MTLALLLILAVVAGLSDTSIGRAFRDSWARLRLPRPSFGRWALVILVIVFIGALIALLKTDGLAVAARALPEGVAWFAAFDVATYIDVLGLAALAALTLRLRVVWTFVRGVGSLIAASLRLIRRRWSARSHRRPCSKPPTSDGDDERWAGAAFA